MFNLGCIKTVKGKIVSLIARSKKNRQLMTVSEINGKKAIQIIKLLRFLMLKIFQKISLIECELETGRTRQIRVHLNIKVRL